RDGGGPSIRSATTPTGTTSRICTKYLSSGGRGRYAAMERWTMSITEHETQERFAELGWLAVKGDETAVDGLISLVGATVKLGDLGAVTSLRLDLERLREHPDAGEVAWV